METIVAFSGIAATTSSVIAAPTICGFTAKITMSALHTACAFSEKVFTPYVLAKYSRLTIEGRLTLIPSPCAIFAPIMPFKIASPIAPQPIKAILPIVFKFSMAYHSYYHNLYSLHLYQRFVVRKP